jgi:hypothetical protein
MDKIAQYENLSDLANKINYYMESLNANRADFLDVLAYLYARHSKEMYLSDSVIFDELRDALKGVEKGVFNKAYRKAREHVTSGCDCRYCNDLASRMFKDKVAITSQENPTHAQEEIIAQINELKEASKLLSSAQEKAEDALKTPLSAYSNLSIQETLECLDSRANELRIQLCKSIDL